MAQSVEQLICNLQVMGSSPFTSSRKKQKALTENSVRAFLFGVPPGFHGEPCADFSRCGKIFSKSLKIISEKYFSRHIGTTERRGSGAIGSNLRVYRQQEEKNQGGPAWSLRRILLKAGSKVTSHSF